MELNGRSLGEVNAEARALPALRNLPASVQIAELGDAQEMQNLFASFGVAMLIGVLCIYGVLVLLFGDFLQPMTILFSLPLSIGGAFVALLLTHDALSMPVDDRHPDADGHRRPRTRSCWSIRDRGAQGAA